ncbi:lysylphosphatidylglycerol synthase domain-containing protein [Shewanella sp. MBTL60-007]|uniref:lysylphosphatidylglycerol synthase domain-containing protein n=1 Tax=Shewanella sp. MBTL60-007 TaxID=2815911 RepID=UPI001C801035|nr:lysylphosphatidylglycerol synthase domain-containing protein [Shewanella sp. MBTL60-007]
MKKGYHWAGGLLVTLCSVFFVMYLVDNWSLLSMSFFAKENISMLSLALLLYLVCFAFTSIAWHRLLVSTGQNTQICQVTTIILISQFGKYIPGNFSHHLGRAVLAHRTGLTSQSISITMTCEIIIVIISAAVIGITAFILNRSLLLSIVPNVSKFSLYLSLIIPLTLIISIFFIPKTFHYLKSYVSNLKFPSKRALSECYLLYTFSFLVFGWILYLITTAYPKVEFTNYWFLTASFTIAWLLGFITPGAPAGLGIREAALISLIAPVYGSGLALSLAVTLRMLTTLGDGLGFLLGLTIRTIKAT